MINLIKILSLLLSLIVINKPILASSSEDSDSEDSEKRKYCQYHKHYEYCKHHKHTKHCSYEKDSLEYNDSNISDSKSENPSVQRLNKVLPKLEKKFKHYKKYHPTSDIQINLADNYLKDEGFEELCGFLSEKSHLKERLTAINLTHNRITSSSLRILKDLLSKFPHLKVDISINRISDEDIDEHFKDSSLKRRIRCEPY